MRIGRTEKLRFLVAQLMETKQTLNRIVKKKVTRFVYIGFLAQISTIGGEGRFPKLGL